MAGSGVSVVAIIVILWVIDPGPAGIVDELTTPDDSGWRMHPLIRHIPITRTMKIVYIIHFLIARTAICRIELYITIYQPAYE